MRADTESVAELSPIVCKMGQCSATCGSSHTAQTLDASYQARLGETRACAV